MSLLDLPNEITRQILTPLVVSGQTFRLKSCEPPRKRYLDQDKSSPAPVVTLEKFPYELDGPQARGPIPLLTLLSIHPALTQIVLQLLGSSNAFSFPDVTTLQCFSSRRIGSLCSLHMSSISIDACGSAELTKGGTYGHFYFDHDPDLNMVEAIKAFPRLKELTLGGVGPGVYSFFGYRDSNGTELERWGQSPEVWDFQQIELIRQLIGLKVASSAEEAQDDGIADISNGEIVDVQPGPLEGGKVIHWKRVNGAIPGVGSGSGSMLILTGCLMFLGTKIVKEGQNTALSQHKFYEEVELADVARAFERSKEQDRVNNTAKSRVLKAQQNAARKGGRVLGTGLPA